MSLFIVDIPECLLLSRNSKEKSKTEVWTDWVILKKVYKQEFGVRTVTADDTLTRITGDISVSVTAWGNICYSGPGLKS